MVAQGYYTARIVGLLISGFCLSLSTFQLVLIGRKRKVPNIKHYIHYCGVVCTLCVFVGFIDIYGVFGLMPFLAMSVIVDSIGTRPLFIGLAIVIVGHFNAHYATLKKETPRFFVWFFGINIVINSIVTLTCKILFYYTLNPSYAVIINVFEILWIVSTLTVDWYGYYLVYHLVHELQRWRSPTATNENDVESQTPLSHHTQKEKNHFIQRLIINNFFNE
jgi:hypothetical protein